LGKKEDLEFSYGLSSGAQKDCVQVLGGILHEMPPRNIFNEDMDILTTNRGREQRSPIVAKQGNSNFDSPENVPSHVQEICPSLSANSFHVSKNTTQGNSTRGKSHLENHAEYGEVPSQIDHSNQIQLCDNVNEYSRTTPFQSPGIENPPRNMNRTDAIESDGALISRLSCERDSKEYEHLSKPVTAELSIAQTQSKEIGAHQCPPKEVPIVHEITSKEIPVHDTTNLNASKAEIPNVPSRSTFLPNVPAIVDQPKKLLPEADPVLLSYIKKVCYTKLNALCYVPDVRLLLPIFIIRLNCYSPKLYKWY
jgi:hypothetical protein